jgi:hypothetical protein
MAKVTIGSFKAEENLKAIVDSGTSVIVGPKNIISEMVK